MIRKFCDVCGTEIFPYEGPSLYPPPYDSKPDTGEVALHGNFNGQHHYLLCHKCVQDIWKFMEKYVEAHKEWINN